MTSRITKRGAAPALLIAQKKRSFLRPPHVRHFVKEGYFFVPRNEIWVVKIPLQWEALTPSDYRNDWVSEPAAAKQAEDYII